MHMFLHFGTYSFTEYKEALVYRFSLIPRGTLLRLELTFKTKDEDIESYHDEMMHVIMNIPGFAEKVHEKHVEVTAENKVC